MNDQNSPTADGQGPGSSPWRNPFEEPQSAQGLPGVPDRGPAAGAGAGGGPGGQAGPARFGGPGGPGWPGGPGGSGGPAAPGVAAGPGAGPRTLGARLLPWRADLVTAAVLVVAGAVLGIVAALAWYRFAPTVWLTLPANAVSQVTSGVDQSSLLVAPEAKGIASVDGYYFVFTGIVGLLLGILAFLLARRGPFGGRDHEGNRDGAAIGAWAGVLLGGLAASTVAAALGRWVSMPDPLRVLHIIAAGHNFHAPVALHAQGLYLAAPLLGMVLFLALTVAFTRPAAPQHPYGPQGYFSADNPYGLPAGGPGQNGQPGPRPDDGTDANSNVPQTDTSLGG